MRGREVGATTAQIFTANQRQWLGKPIDREGIALWRQALDETGMRWVMSHDSYLINLGANAREVEEKSRIAFREEIDRSLQLGLAFLNFHPGSATGDTEERCLDRIARNLLAIEPMLEGENLVLLIETTAGQGTSVGYSFEHLDYIVKRVEARIPIGVCIDTCHIFAAGYPIRTEKEWDATLEAFDRTIGIERLRALHVNDSLHPLGSRKDRHASLGQGYIGEEGFRAMMRHPQLRGIPKYLETPNGEAMWRGEIASLRAWAEG